MQVQTVIISNREDVSVEYLISKIRLLTDSYLRINSEDIGHVSFEIIPGEKKRCLIQDQEFSLDNVRSVLFRRIPSKFDRGSEGDDHAYLSLERKHFFEGLYLSFDKAKWINPMFATQIAERKLFQLEVARQLGLKIPKSIMTSDRTKALRFLERVNYAIIKPISNGLQVVGDKVFSIYTTEVTLQVFSRLDLATTFDTPVYLQEKISNKHDLRITIIGSKVFAVKIEKDNDDVDWRKPEITKTYAQVTLPKALVQLLFKLHSTLQMVYSAIDMIYTPNGEYVFLEINPVGEWVWLEQQLGIDISAEFIKQLL